MKNLVVVIFSYHRPLQLDLTLRSLSRHDEDYGEPDIKVIYRCDNDRFKKAYLNLAKEYEQVEFIEEMVFQTNVTMAMMDYKYVMFLTDDTVFTKDFSITEIVTLLDKSKKVLGFSLRLGLNTDYCYPLNKQQKLPVHQQSKNFLFWTWMNEEHDWGYPLEVSSSVYRVETILSLLNTFNVANPNTFEYMMDRSKSNVGNLPIMACYRNSVAFANPINKIKPDNQNRSGTNPKYSVDSLLTIYEIGGRINPREFDDFVPNGAHQEFEFNLGETNG
jgi:hypothetical protein